MENSIDIIQTSYGLRKLRTPMARQFDRNCVLSSTAAQLIVADHLNLPVKAIRVVDDCPFDTGPIASDIVLESPKVDADTTTVAMAGVVGFLLAAGMELEEQMVEIGSLQKDITIRAFGHIYDAIEDGSFARLVISLDGLRVVGERPYGSGN